MNYRNSWLNSCFGSDNGNTITVYFRDGRAPATYPETSLQLLKTENIVDCITSDETGEILYDCGL